MCNLTRGERFKDARTVHNKNGNQSMDEVYKATGVAASMIKDLEDDDKNRSVGYEKIAALAKHYGVSSDYLLGLSPNPTTNKNIDAVCKFTGLSEDNTAYLNRIHTACKKNDDGIRNFHKYELMLINDFIRLCNDGGITTSFWLIHANLDKTKGKYYEKDEINGSSPNGIVSHFIEEHGLVVLPLRSGLEYHAQQAAEELRELLMTKYIKSAL